MDSIIMNLSVNDLLMLNDFQRIAKEAQNAYELIAKKYANSFGIGTKEIEVYERVETEYSGYGVLTIDGVFKYHDNWWGGRDWEIKVSSPDGIFHIFRLQYLYNMLDVFRRNGDENTAKTIEEMVKGSDESITSVAYAINDWIKQIKG
ncbi:MAG: hypothetical protein IKI57_02340 [Clostridia bacterium]|nr:hypothetical protein [Clostridia bacterium]